jgi:hypothetical protein
MLYQSLHNRLENQQEAIEFIIADKDKACLNFHPTPGKWSIHDNIAHLARYQPIFTERINAILNNNNPSFERYVAEEDPHFDGWRQQYLPNLIKTLKADRRILFNIITTIPSKKINRTGVHTKFGQLTIPQWVEFFLLHEAHHLFTIFQLANTVVLPVS